MGIRKDTFIEVTLLELLCYVPVAAIAGNILPPIGPFKLHWLYIGATMLAALLSLLKTRSMNSLLAFIVGYALIQASFSIHFSVIDFFDFISGPLLFIAIVNTVIADKIDIARLKHYRKKILFGFGIPITIAILQFFKVLPLELLNASYVNVTVYGTEVLNRVNGFLYHAIELAVVIFFFFVNVAMTISPIRAYIIMSSMIVLEYITYIKTGILTSVLYTTYFGYFIDRRLRTFKTLAITGLAIVGFSYVYILIPDIESNRLRFDMDDLKFESQLFTGRGYIWNVYIDGIQASFNGFNVIFGGGFGSSSHVFRAGLFGGEPKNNWLPGPHNQLLELFVNGGLVAIWLIVTILVKQFKKLRIYFRENRKEFAIAFIPVLVIPLFVIGMTAPVMNMFIYWCGLAATVLTLKIKFHRPGE